MKPLPLQWRVPLLAGLVVAMVSLFGLGLVVRESAAAGERQLRDSARSLSLALLPALRNTLVVGDLAMAQEAFEPIVGRYGVRRIALLRPQDRQVMIESAGKGDDPPPPWWRFMAGSGSYAEEFPVNAGGVDYGILRLEMSGQAMMEGLRQASWRYFWLAAACLVLTGALLAVVLRRSLEPLRRLARGAHRIAAGELSVRLEAGAVPEIAEVVHAFNAMSEEIESAIGRLQLSETRLTEAQRIAHVGDWVWEVASGAHSWSDENCRIFGLEPPAAAPSHEAFLALLLPEDRERVLAHLGQAVAGRKTFDCEFRIRRPAGDVRHVIARAEVIRDGAGEAIRLVGANLDVTDRKQAEEEIRQLNQDLERRVAERTAELETVNRELESFSYSVSHDLRAPLRAVEGFSRMLLEDYYDRLDDDARHYLNVLCDNANRMRQLIDDILAFSRMSRQDLRGELVDMSALMGEVFADIKAVLPERVVELRLGKLPPARGDRAMLRQVAQNLLGNAVKFTSPRTEAVIEVSGAVQDGETVYCVRDNGVGFDSQFGDKLFGVFQRLHSQQEFEGTGIGLAIVKRIIGRHGGRVWAESKLGEGAAFHFTLPVVDGTAVATAGGEVMQA
jgi:PAS domain S-box-containing protein